MITKKQIALVTLAALALAIPALGDPAKTKELSIAGYASARWVFNLVDGTATTEQTSVCLGLGICRATGSGEADMDPFGGFFIVASGEQIFWTMTPNGPFQVAFNGGTGRFENATGGLSTTWESDRIYTFPDPGTMIMEVTYTFAGTLTY